MAHEIHPIPSSSKNTIQIADISSDEFDLDPPYQRGYVWELTDKQQMILSINKNTDLASFVFNNETNGKKMIRTVIDGKQRITAIREFIRNEFCYVDVSDEDEEEHVYFSEVINKKDPIVRVMSKDEREKFLKKEIFCATYTNLTLQQQAFIFRQIQRGVKITQAEILISGISSNKVKILWEIATLNAHWLLSLIDVNDKDNGNDIVFIIQLMYFLIKDTLPKKDQLEELVKNISDTEFIKVTEKIKNGFEWFRMYVDVGIFMNNGYPKRMEKYGFVIIMHFLINNLEIIASRKDVLMKFMKELMRFIRKDGITLKNKSRDSLKLVQITCNKALEVVIKELDKPEKLEHKKHHSNMMFVKKDTIIKSNKSRKRDN